MPKIKRDDRGLLVRTGGYDFRPGPLGGYDHAYRMDDAGLQEGDVVKAHHMGGTILAKITAPSGQVVYWSEEASAKDCGPCSDVDPSRFGLDGRRLRDAPSGAKVAVPGQTIRVIKPFLP